MRDQEDVTDATVGAAGAGECTFSIVTDACSGLRVSGFGFSDFGIEDAGNQANNLKYPPELGIQGLGCLFDMRGHHVLARRGAQTVPDFVSKISLFLLRKSR